MGFGMVEVFFVFSIFLGSGIQSPKVSLEMSW